MIPKIIHYCWFGGSPLPKDALECIASWKRYHPDYEIKEWNENNFNVHMIPFMSEAYSANKYAYVSDYARLWVLYNYGGVYFDTDVEVIRPLDDIFSMGSFMGIEKCTRENVNGVQIAIGLGFASQKGDRILKEIMDFYETHHYIYPDGHMEQIPIVPITTDVLARHGFDRQNRLQKIGDFTIYPWDFFCPIEFLSSKLDITSNTRTIHHYTATWMSWTDKLKMKKGSFFDRNPIGIWLKKRLKNKFYK